MNSIEGRSSFGHDDLVACGRGQGEWAGFPKLPLLPMLMFDRITSISEAGGEEDNGCIRAELKISPQAWFFQCHFSNDPVMPGCLQLDALWQLTGFFLGWRGARGKGRALGVGHVKFSGEILPSSRLVEYEVEILAARIRDTASLGRANGTLKCDGAVVCTAEELRVIISPSK